MRARWHCLWGYVENVAHAIALAVQNERAAGRIYNVAQPIVAEAEWIRPGAAADWSGEVIPLPKARLPEYLRMTSNYEQDWAMSSDRIRRELGYAEIVAESEALRRTISWERENLPAEIDPAKYDYEAEDAVLAALGAQSPRASPPRRARTTTPLTPAPPTSYRPTPPSPSDP